MHLIDSARTRVKCVPVVHEVAAGIAVEYFNQVSNAEHAFALVTAGPGLTNIVTAMAGAWLQHRNLLVIGGQVKSTDLMSGGIRQRGIQEIDGVSIVSSICKFAMRIERPVSEHILKAAVQAGMEGRKGPVFLEICLDAQGAPPFINTSRANLSSRANTTQSDSSSAANEIALCMATAQRPVWLIGAGIDRTIARRLRNQLEGLGFPLLTTWHGSDRLSSRSSNYFGRPETWGQRTANLIINQADLLVVFGARLGLQETGFNWQEYAANAHVIQVEIDDAELHKGHPRIDKPILADANVVLAKIMDEKFQTFPEWMSYCAEIRDELSLNEPWNETREQYVSPYDFYINSSAFSSADDVWIPASSGGANSVAIQALQQWGNQIVVCDDGLASMGYGLAGAIGAAFAAPNKRIWLVEGDGGFSQNLQELATVAVNKLNIKMFIFANDGYGSIRTTQKNYFGGSYLGCDTKTGLGFPNWHTLADAYGIPSRAFPAKGFDDPEFGQAMEAPGPFLVVVPIDPEQTYWPKITSRVTESGSMASNPLYMMSPDLPKELLSRIGRYL